MKSFSIKTPLSVQWHLTTPGGNPFSLAGYTYTLKYKTGRGMSVAKNLSVPADEEGNPSNIIVWDFSAEEQSFTGIYDLELSIYRSGKKLITSSYVGAFSLERFGHDEYVSINTVSHGGNHPDGINPDGPFRNGSADNAEVVHLFSSAEWWLYKPVEPVCDNGIWYVNGHKVTDPETDKPVPAYYSFWCDKNSFILYAFEGGLGLYTHVDPETGEETIDTSKAVFYIDAIAEFLNKVDVDNTTILFNDEGKLEVKDKGISSEKISDSLMEYIDKSGMVDDETITKNKETGVISVKDNSISSYKLSEDVRHDIDKAYKVDDATIGRNAETGAAFVKDGAITSDKLSEEVTSSIRNAAKVDEEDITRNADGKLQFKDRDNTDGMGYVILRKDKTFAEQVTEANTIYEIRYDFDLAGGEVHIPNECILMFVGGSLKNGIIDFNRCEINASEHSYIFNGLSNFTGIDKVSACWFGAKGDAVYDNTDIFKFLCNNARNITVFLPKGIYKITECVNPLAASDANYRKVKIIGEKCPFVSASLKLAAIPLDARTIIYCAGNDSTPFLYGVSALENITLRGEDNNDTSTYTNFRPLYDNTIGLCLKAPSTSEYYTGVSIHNVQIMFFGTALLQGAGFDNKIEDLLIRRNVFGWVIDIPDSSPNGMYITDMSVRDVIVDISVKTNLKWTLKDSHLVVENLCSQHANLDLEDGYYEIDIYKGDVTFVGGYCENDLNESSHICVKTDSTQVGIWGMVLHRGIYQFGGPTIIANSRSYDARIESTSSFVGLSSYFHDFTSSNYSFNFINTTITERSTQTSSVPLAVHNYNGTYSIEGLRTVFANEQNTRLLKPSTSDLLFLKISGQEYNIPLHVGMVGNTQTESCLYYDSTRRKVLFRKFSQTMDVFGRNGLVPLYAASLQALTAMGNNDTGFIQFNTANSQPYFWAGTKWVDANGYVQNGIRTLTKSGTYAQRPSMLENENIGYCYFCTDTNKPIYWTGTKWVDATGVDA